MLGARGYAECGQELLTQAADLATVVVALGSGGTMAGLVAALGPERVLGVDVGAVADPGRVVSHLVSGLSGTHCPPESLRIRLDQVGSGYSALTEPVMTALTLAARTEGMVLDPVYTGRAMAGLTAAVEAGDITPGGAPSSCTRAVCPVSSATGRPSNGRRPNWPWTATR